MITRFLLCSSNDCTIGEEWGKAEVKTTVKIPKGVEFDNMPLVSPLVAKGFLCQNVKKQCRYQW